MAHYVFDPDQNKLVLRGNEHGNGLPKPLDPEHGTDYGKPVRATVVANVSPLEGYTHFLSARKVK